jgi:16S rRNA C1402 (ribose-2'-O) methylase RsmI
VRGEFTIVLGPIEQDANGPTADGDVVVVALERLRSDGVPRSEAVKLVCDMHGLPKSAVYKKALEIDPW